LMIRVDGQRLPVERGERWMSGEDFRAMKISDLIRETGVPKQTIHYYIQKGLLPKPRKLGSNSAEYGPAHVERIRLIKELQEHYFLPLAVIKKILARHRGQSESLIQFKLKTGYFKPLDQLLSGSIKGEQKFLEATGLALERLAQYEAWGIITPKGEGEQKLYSHEDCVIGRVIAQFREIGMTQERGFEPDILRELVETFREVVRKGADVFYRTAQDVLSEAEIAEIYPLAAEITALFYYHMYLKLNKEISLERLRKP